MGLAEEHKAMIINPFGNDGINPCYHILKDSIIIMRKEHICNECNRKINIGERARRQNGILGNNRVKYYWHIQCLVKMHNEWYNTGKKNSNLKN